MKPATWHWFAIKGEGARPLFAFPGIWRRYRGPVKKDGPNVDIETYSFLTTTPNPLVATINHERMPVLLTREEQFATWLRGSPDEAFALAREYPPEQMRIVQEGLRQGRPFECCLAAWVASPSRLNVGERGIATPATVRRAPKAHRGGDAVQVSAASEG